MKCIAKQPILHNGARYEIDAEIELDSPQRLLEIGHVVPAPVQEPVVPPVGDEPVVPAPEPETEIAPVAAPKTPKAKSKK